MKNPAATDVGINSTDTEIREQLSSGCQGKECPRGARLEKEEPWCRRPSRTFSPRSLRELGTVPGRGSSTSLHSLRLAAVSSMKPSLVFSKKTENFEYNTSYSFLLTFEYLEYRLFFGFRAKLLRISGHDLQNLTE